MQTKKLFRFLLCTIISILPSTYANANNSLASEQAKKLVKDAIIYALESQDPHLNYGRYVSKNFINRVDDNTFNFKQWVQHQKHIKAMVKSMKPTFDLLVAEHQNVAALYRIHLIKNDGSTLDVKDMAFFKIKNNKIVYVEELTRLIKGNIADKNIGSLK